jgi:hypothetical protein
MRQDDGYDKRSAMSLLSGGIALLSFNDIMLNLFQQEVVMITYRFPIKSGMTFSFNVDLITLLTIKSRSL